jgi:hypothetical protein
MTVRILAVLAAVAFAVASVPTVASAGTCDHSWQRAKDGSRCGDRAADRRDGGDSGY